MSEERLQTEAAADLKELGRNRMEIVRTNSSKEELDAAWPQVPEFAFEWGDCWNACVEYSVEDFDAEVAFYLDGLGCRPNALSVDYAMFKAPDDSFYIGFNRASESLPATPSGALHVCFMVRNVAKTIDELERRGVTVVSRPEPQGKEGVMVKGVLQSPNGTIVDLWDVA